MELSKNTILITGGTSGFGLEFAARFIELGNTVIITGRNARKLEETKQVLPGVHTIQSDVTKIEDIAALYSEVKERFPELNILINNAGEMRKIILHDAYAPEEITREVEVNLMGPIRMVQTFLPLLKKQRSAAIMNVTSGIAMMPFPIAPIYGATKSGLRSYTQSLRVQLKKTNIEVFELAAPGSSTPLNDKFRGDEGFDPKRVMPPAEIVNKAIEGLKKDTFEILPGFSKIIYFMSRLAPKFILSQASKVGAAAMSGT